MSCLLVWLLACAREVIWNCLFIPEVYVGKCWDEVCAALSLHRKPEWSYQLSRCDSVNTGQAMSPLLSTGTNICVPLAGNKGVRGKLSCRGKALSLQQHYLLKVRLYLSGWHCHTDGFVHFQVALLDFGATRGFDYEFIDVYIEVRMCTVSWSAELGVLFAKWCLSLSCITLYLKLLWVWMEAGLETRESLLPFHPLP